MEPVSRGGPSANDGLCRAAIRAGAALLTGFLLGPLPAPAYEFGVAPSPVLALDSYEAGASPAHRLSFDVQSGELEVYRAAITYPAGFRFNGFDALGPRNTPIGALLVDFNFDGVPDITILLRSLSASSAYADVIADGRFNSGLEPMLGAGGRTEFTLVLPFGGDANPDTLTVPRRARITVILYAGVLTNPDAPGTHTIRAELISVDPDTDGPDDGLGSSPLTVAFAVDVTIASSADAFRPLFLHGSGGPANQPTLFLDGATPSSPTEKHRDSAPVRFSGGNPWKEIGAWSAAPGAAGGALSAPTPLLAWIGLRNSDDQGTRFDLRVDVDKNDATVATGTARCITGVTRNPARATAAAVPINPFSFVDFNGSTDVLRLRIFTRIGTNTDGIACSGPGGHHTSAAGLRLYFDSAGRPSVLGAPR